MGPLATISSTESPLQEFPPNVDSHYVKSSCAMKDPQIHKYNIGNHCAPTDGSSVPQKSHDGNIPLRRFPRWGCSAQISIVREIIRSGYMMCFHRKSVLWFKSSYNGVQYYERPRHLEDPDGTTD